MKYDLHIHTYNSACSVLRSETILKVAKKVGLDGIAITDHDTIKGGVGVSKANKDRDFDVIPGIEVYTDRGHVLGFYVNEEIRSREFFGVVDEIKKQGGIVVIAHPFRLMPMLRSKFKGVDVKKYLDAVECYNGRTSYLANKQSNKFADKLSLAKIGGSDAHFSFEIGKAITVFEGDLRSAIKNGKTRAELGDKMIGNTLTGLTGSTLSFFYKRLFRRR